MKKQKLKQLAYSINPVLPKKNRLPAKMIKEVMNLGKWFRGKQLSLAVMEGGESENVRLAVLVPLKLDKKASVRNKIKRRTMEIFRNKINYMTRGKDLVVLIHGGALRTTKDKLEATVEALISKTKENL